MQPHWGDLQESWRDVDVDAGSLWATSGARWLSDPGLGVPDRLVSRFAGLVEFIDQRGAGLADLTGSRGLGLLAERAGAMGLPPARGSSCGGASRFVRCNDGWIVVSLARSDDVDLVSAWLEIDPPPVADPWPAIERSVAKRLTDEIVARAALLGLPCSAVGEVTSPQAVRTMRLGDAPSRQLDGLVVMNLAALWAGPLCADVLGRMGARVITIESTRRPDGGRAARRFFDSLHSRSESVALDLAHEAGRARLRALLARADVVIEGSRPRALEQMGVDARSVASAGPAIWLSITSHGRSGANRHRVGFGDDAAGAGGLVGWVGNEPRFVADAIADPLTGVTAAAAAVQLLESGGRWLVDVALARVARSMVGEWLPAPSGTAPARPLPRAGSRTQMPLGRDTAAVLADLGVD